MAKIGDKIKEERLKKGLNQPDLAKIMCVSKQTVSNWESNKRTPDIDTLKKLSEFFNVSTDYLLGKNTHENSPESLITSKETTVWEPTLNEKDKKDIEKMTNDFLNGLDGGVMLNGEILDDVTLELFKQSVKNGIQYAKLTNKKKYTPKKYRSNKESK